MPSWTIEKLEDLCWCFFEASKCLAGKGHSPELKASVVEDMAALGHEGLGWDAIRYVGVLLCIWCILAVAPIEVVRAASKLTLAMASSCVRRFSGANRRVLFGCSFSNFRPKCRRWSSLSHKYLAPPNKIVSPSPLFVVPSPSSSDTIHHSPHKKSLFRPIKQVIMARWDDIRDDLFNAYVAVSPPLNSEQQEEIVRIMKARGHDMVWNAIRYIFPSVCDLIFSLSRSIIFFLSSTFILRHTTINLNPLLQDSVTMGKANAHTWDAEAEADLLKAMNVHFRPNAEDCKKMAPMLHAKGYNFSDNALLQHLQKLRRKEGAGAPPAKDNGEGSSTAVPKTPASGRKRAAPGAAKKTNSTRGKKANRSEVVNAFLASNEDTSPLDNEDDDELDAVATPSKKPRVKREAKVKKEKPESDDEAVSLVKKEKGGEDQDNAIVL
ncbi:hypothetical protein QBC34DRAFT_70936 [Podospora aff. communis PSN243]|uniref:Uncharacterized protein n=1 Tax=Podospora aff. communis PSN243 TaxID=3040156 RepID=A0AAV9H3G7_9PEZI|nr:hypothetical protein QBC34DRAFT_70936 [Podospora aff. communis PSN243]